MLCAALTALGPASAAGQVPVTRVAVPCDAPDADPWIGDLRESVVGYDGLARFALERYGIPVACEGAVTDEFDGAKFGHVVLRFAGDIALEVRTMPPETSVWTLRAPAGFGDEGAVRRALEEHASGIGLAIDWATPQVRTEGDELVHAFWDPDEGLNASASLIFSGGRLVAVRVSMAL